MMRLFLMLAVAMCATQASASTVSGQGKAIDSTIIQISDKRVMLFGVDSVMRKQACMLDGKPWQCWTAAVQDLQTLLDRGPVSCDVVGEPDVYGRLLGRCSVDGQSINEQFIARGFGVARVSDTSDYVAAEVQAKEKKVGLWQGKFAPPSEFRRSAGVAVERP